MGERILSASKSGRGRWRLIRRMDVVHPVDVPDLAISPIDDYAAAASQAFLRNISAHVVEHGQAEKVRLQRFGNPMPLNIHVLG